MSGRSRSFTRKVLFLSYMRDTPGDIMRKDLGVRPCIYPEPVLILAAYGEDGVPCAMNAAWGGIHEENEIFICLDPSHKTTKNILLRKEFTVSIGTEDLVAECDYLGIVSGNDIPDKVSRCGLTTVRSEKIDAPIINELPMTIECRMKSYDESTCELVAEIVNISVDESILNDKGLVDPMKMRPLIYDGLNKKYYGYGSVVGKAFGEGKRLM